MKKLIIIYIATTLFLGANLAYCVVQIEQLTDASKAAWYELDMMRVKHDLDKMQTEYEIKRLRNELEAKK